MVYAFRPAVRAKVKARMAIDGPSGSGKTYTALTAASAFSPAGRIAVIDTERGSASLYSDIFTFEVLELDYFDPINYVMAIQAAEDAGYEVIVIDSLSHAWEGEGGRLPSCCLSVSGLTSALSKMPISVSIQSAHPSLAADLT